MLHRPGVRLPLAAVTALSSLLSLALPAAGQSTLDAPQGIRLPYALDTGPVLGAGDGRAAFSRHITVQGAIWLRLHFSLADLPAGAAVVVTSARDGETQRLDPAAMAIWSNSTAYFNGDTVLLELFVPAGAPPARLAIEQIETDFPAHHRGDPGQCGICSTDNRVPTTQAWTGRLMPVGCTASLVCENSTFVTAGHCIQSASEAAVMQFNVPASQSDCGLVTPPIADQFPVITSSRRFENAGVGEDWGVFRVGPNNLNQTPFQRYGEVRRISPNPAPDGVVVNIFGYGADTTCTRHHVQQRSVGNITNVAATSYRFNADVRNGNSGSAILYLNQVVGVVTHCGGDGCSNRGTRVDVQDFRDAINEIMDCDVTHALQVRAVRAADDAPVPAPITVVPADNNGDASGVAPLDREFLDGVTVSLTAPAESGSLCFDSWRLNGADQGPSPTLQFTITADATAIARYRSCCLTDWDGSGSVNSADISAFLTAWLDSLNNSNLNADFDGSGSVNSADISAFLTQWLAEVSGGC